MQDEIYITKDGLNKLKAELQELKDVKLVEVAKNIQIAREHGDISENSAYDDAKREQALVEGKVKELEEIIRVAKVTEENHSSINGEITVGSKVRVHIEGEEVEFHIVGALEANPSERKISHESPIGSALLGKKIGDKVEVEAPIGKVTYTILKVE